MRGRRDYTAVCLSVAPIGVLTITCIFSRGERTSNSSFEITDCANRNGRLELNGTIACSDDQVVRSCKKVVAVSGAPRGNSRMKDQ